MIKRLLFGSAFLLALCIGVLAQVTVPNTLVDGATILAGPLNTNFTTIANHALDRLTGGNISGTITVDPGITIDGVDIGAVACATCAPTFKDLTLASPATGLTVGGNVIVNTVGKIPALTSTYFGSTDASTLTGITASQVSGVALLGTANAFTARNDFLTYTETKTVVTPGATPAIDLSLGTHFTYANSTTPTFSFTNAPASGKAGSFTLAITGNGTSHPPTWPASVKWASGVAPTITTTNTKVDILTFISYDGGATWFGFIAGQNF